MLLLDSYWCGNIWILSTHLFRPFPLQFRAHFTTSPADGRLSGRGLSSVPHAASDFPGTLLTHHISSLDSHSSLIVTGFNRPTIWCSKEVWELPDPLHCIPQNNEEILERLLRKEAGGIYTSITWICLKLIANAKTSPIQNPFRSFKRRQWPYSSEAVSINCCDSHQQSKANRERSPTNIDETSFPRMVEC